MNTKHGTKQRKVWRKLNIAIDDDGEILSSTLTTHEVSDVSQIPDLLEEIDVPLDEFIGDAGRYDQAKNYETLLSHEQKKDKSIQFVLLFRRILALNLSTKMIRLNAKKTFIIYTLLAGRNGKKIHVMVDDLGLKMPFIAIKQSLVERYVQKT